MFKMNLSFFCSSSHSLCASDISQHFLRIFFLLALGIHFFPRPSNKKYKKRKRKIKQNVSNKCLTFFNFKCIPVPFHTYKRCFFSNIFWITLKWHGMDVPVNPIHKQRMCFFFKKKCEKYFAIVCAHWFRRLWRFLDKCSDEKIMTKRESHKMETNLCRSSCCKVSVFCFASVDFYLFSIESVTHKKKKTFLCTPAVRKVFGKWRILLSLAFENVPDKELFK